MKKLLYLMLLAVLALPFQSCEDDEIDTVWKEANEEAFNKIATNSTYSQVLIPGGPTPIYYKVIKSGTGTETPIQTSKVKVLYTGTYYDGTVFDAGSSTTNVPVEFSTYGVVRGFSTTLQKMVVGDKWEVWIPWYLGYGNVTTNGIPAYSTLVFEVELVSITQYP